MRTPRRTPAEPSLAVAILWLLLAACAVVMFLGGLQFLTGTEDTPTPRPTVTVTVWEPPSPTPLPTPLPDTAEDDWPNPAPSQCTDADKRRVIPRDRWTPCGQLLGYFDDWATPPPDAPPVIMDP